MHAAPLRLLLPLPPLRRPKQPLGWQGRHATAAPAPPAEAVPAGAPLFGQPAAASAAAEERQLGGGLRALLSPLSDARANAKLLALCTGAGGGGRGGDAVFCTEQACMLEWHLRRAACCLVHIYTRLHTPMNLSFCNP